MMTTVTSVETRPKPMVPEHFIARIVEELHPLEIWLFGSRAKGTARPDSDWDFLAILNDAAPERDFDTGDVWRRLKDIHRKRVEVLTLTRSEFERWRLSLGSLAQIVSDEGVVVYGG